MGFFYRLVIPSSDSPAFISGFDDFTVVCDPVE